MLNRVILTEADVGGNYSRLQIWRECKLWHRQKVVWATDPVFRQAWAHLEDDMIIVRSFDGDLRKHPSSSTTEGMLGTQVLIQGPNQFSGVIHWRAMVCSSAVPVLGKESTVIYNLKSTLFCQFNYTPWALKNLCPIRCFEHCML